MTPASPAASKKATSSRPTGHLRRQLARRVLREPPAQPGDALCLRHAVEAGRPQEWLERAGGHQLVQRHAAAGRREHPLEELGVQPAHERRAAHDGLGLGGEATLCAMTSKCSRRAAGAEISARVRRSGLWEDGALTGISALCRGPARRSGCEIRGIQGFLRRASACPKASIISSSSSTPATQTRSSASARHSVNAKLSSSFRALAHAAQLERIELTPRRRREDVHAPQLAFAKMGSRRCGVRCPATTPAAASSG